MRNRILLLLMFLLNGVVYGQKVNFEWANAMGGTDNDEINSIAVDAVGNVYAIGDFYETVDFDPGSNIFNLMDINNGDIFISKTDPSGAFVWAKRIGGAGLDVGLGITLDMLGHIYITGSFQGTVDFDPNAGIFNIVSPSGSSEIFVSKLDTSGGLIWAKAMLGNFDDAGLSIAVDVTGNVYTTGYFKQTVDFDPGAGIANLTSTGGVDDIFVSKLDALGNFVWAKKMGGSSQDRGLSATVDSMGNVYTTGFFYGTVDFDPSAGIANLISSGQNDIFVQKLNASGGFVWAKRIGGTDYDSHAKTVLDAVGNIYTTGTFKNTVDFDPGVGIYNLTSAGQRDIFVSKWDTSGALVWAKRMGSIAEEHSSSIEIDMAGNIYTTGILSCTNGSVDLDPDAGIVNAPCSGLSNLFVSKLSNSGLFLWAEVMGGTFYEPVISLDAFGNIYTAGYFQGTPDFDPSGGIFNITSLGFGDIFMVKLSQNGISGRVYQDFNQNCIRNTNEIGLANRMLMINPGNIMVTTNSNGVWGLDSLPVGNYTIIADTTGNWLPTCAIAQSFTVVHPDSATISPNFGFISITSCPAPSIAIHVPFLRIGFSNQKVYVNACNLSIGTDTLANAYAIIELDSLFSVQSGSQSYTSLGNNQYRVNLGTIYPGYCVNFWLNCTLSANAVLGQTLCMAAKLYPINTCALDPIPNPYPANSTPCNTPYDQSHLDIDAFCNNDTINFTIVNNGTGNMSCFAPVRLYIDGIYTQLDSVQIPSGDTVVFAYAGDGRTWRMEVNQHPLHPGNSNPSATIERCGNVANWTPNLVNIRPHDDADPVIDIYCGLVTGSYDPNDKTGYPLGVGSNHDIEPNQDMEYVIRFQNTGTDTAFTVVIRDTLSMDLDVFSVRSGASSHDYSFRMYGPRVLEWTFNNIMLPDSNVNLIGSNGFVTFKVRQVPNLPVGTVIENSASIYFDFNAPIFTNTSWHTIDLPQDLNWDGVQTLNVAACENYSFNNLDYDNSGTYWQVVQNGALDSLYTLNLTIDEMPSDSITLSGTTLTAYTPNLSYQWLDCNNGNTPIAGETSQSFTPLMNGDYAVEMTDGTCTIVSNCMNVTGVVVEKLVNDLGILIYPNPTTGILHLEKGTDSEISIEVLDNLGRVLLVQTSNDLITNVNLNYLPAGIYYVSISNGEKIVKEKIVKQ
jgi:uncharacterized repeat protein (TIGR01451 family)